MKSWVRFPPRSKDFFFTSCGSLIPFTRANAQWVTSWVQFSTLNYTSELILCSTIIWRMFGIFTVNFGMEFSKWHACLPKLLKPNRFAALLPQSDKTFQYHNEYRMLRSSVRTLPFKFHQLFVCLQFI